jgi:hypothetical protein
MSLAIPKIVFPSGGGTTFNLTFPPRQVPFKSYQATKHINIASSGVSEVIYERRDEFLVFTMETVKAGSDVSGWDIFMQSALQGIPFDYYPDGTLGAFTTYVYDDTGWEAKYLSLGLYQFQLRFRKRVSWP